MTLFKYFLNLSWYLCFSFAKRVWVKRILSLCIRRNSVYHVKLSLSILWLMWWHYQETLLSSENWRQVPWMTRSASPSLNMFLCVRLISPAHSHSQHTCAHTRIHMPVTEKPHSWMHKFHTAVQGDIHWSIYTTSFSPVYTSCFIQPSQVSHQSCLDSETLMGGCQWQPHLSASWYSSFRQLVWKPAGNKIPPLLKLWLSCFELKHYMHLTLEPWFVVCCSDCKALWGEFEICHFEAT